jgi:tRNA guanosine-2'-O-methyltransferase
VELLQQAQSLVTVKPDKAQSVPDEQLPNILAYLDFVKCSYWLPTDDYHYVTPELVRVICSFVGVDRLDDAVHDALSSLLSLLLQKPTNLVRPLSKDGTEPASMRDSPDWKPLEKIVDQQLWDRYRKLPDDYFCSSSKAFRTWFQWVCCAKAGGVELLGLCELLYWSRLRSGLLSGFSEQRKYCLGILRQSLDVAQQDIKTPLMVFDVARKADYLAQYEKYSSFFETIVLDRYQNQIQACLPELTKLLGHGSLVAPGWITTLLSAVLSPKVQDGVRKLVGTWFIDLVTKRSHDFQTHDEFVAFLDQNAHFLVEGFLPWATQGSLFTSTLVSTRKGTGCNHGRLLSEVISVFVTLCSPSVGRELLNGVLRFILDKGGRIFQYSIPYLLQGLVSGFRSSEYLDDLEAKDFRLLSSVSRLPGLPEIASDLCAVYCWECCAVFDSNKHGAFPGYDELRARIEELRLSTCNQSSSSQTNDDNVNSITSLRQFLVKLESSQHRCIRDDSFSTACDDIITFLDQHDRDSLPYEDLCAVLEALWEEADRQEYRRPIAVKVPALFFHPNCTYVCVAHSSNNKGIAEGQRLMKLLATVMERLHGLAESRPYLLSTFFDSVCKAAFAHPQILAILPFEDLLVRFIEKPPVPKTEFLFEVAAAEQLQNFFEHLTYESYYGKREWHAYAAVIDLLNRFPDEQLEVARRVFERVLEHWRTQKKPVPIISKWKDTFQLQAMLLLSESCISEQNAAGSLESFMHALVLEQWPRYRFLLEWIISRIYYRFPRLAERILPDLAKLDDTVPTQVASLMKLAVLAAPFRAHFQSGEKFTLQFMTLLIPFSASPKVQIRHEAHWSFPIMFELAERKGWAGIVDNPAFRALNDFIRGLDKFKRPASTTRTLKLDAVEDFSIVNIFQGDYLTIETPERVLVTFKDFANVWNDDDERFLDKLYVRIPLGRLKSDASTHSPDSLTSFDQPLSIVNSDPHFDKTDSLAAPLQTKSGFDLSSLLPPPGPPSATQKRPASVILVASLIDNPTNLGGLSRISESFGLEALCINSLTHLGSKDFQSTAVTSHKHLPIHELKIENVPTYLIDMKRKGYEVVAIEQTDRSGILGQGGEGALPEKCVLVLGSEKGGVSSEVLAVVDRCVEIRTVGVTRSLNVQTAGGITVYEWWREWGGQV